MKLLRCAITALVFIQIGAFGLRLDEHTNGRHTYELKLKRIEDDRDNEVGRALQHSRVTGEASQFVSLDTVTASSIALKESGGNRLWTSYYADLFIGDVDSEENRFKVLFDTGSSELWVPDELCQSDACLTRKRLYRNGTWKPKYDEKGNYVPISIKYLTGEMLAIDGNADVNLSNGIIVKGASVGLATKIDIPIMTKLPWDGIVGLGFTTDDQQSRGATSLLETLSRNAWSYPNFRNQFAYYISKHGGTITFGGYNNDYKRSPQDEFMWASIVPEGNYWAVNLLEITVREPTNTMSQHRKYRGGRHSSQQASNAILDPNASGYNTRSTINETLASRATVMSNSPAPDGGNYIPDSRESGSYHSVGPAMVDKENQKAGLSVTSDVENALTSTNDIIYRNHFDDTKIIIDTGTYLIYAPQNMRTFLKTLQLEQCEDKKRLPNLVFTLGESGAEKVTLEFTPDDYVIHYSANDGSTLCTLGIIIDEQQEELQLNAWTFGEIFLRAYYTVFDYDQRKIGFAPSSRDL